MNIAVRTILLAFSLLAVRVFAESFGAEVQACVAKTNISPDSPNIAQAIADCDKEVSVRRETMERAIRAATKDDPAAAAQPEALVIEPPADHPGAPTIAIRAPGDRLPPGIVASPAQPKKDDDFKVVIPDSVLRSHGIDPSNVGIEPASAPAPAITQNNREQSMNIDRPAEIIYSLILGAVFIWVIYFIFIKPPAPQKVRVQRKMLDTRTKRIALLALPFLSVTTIYMSSLIGEYNSSGPAVLFMLFLAASILCLLIAFTRLGDWVSKKFSSINTRLKRMALLAFPFLAVITLHRMVLFMDERDPPSLSFLLFLMASILCLLITFTRLGDWVSKK